MSLEAFGAFGNRLDDAKTSHLFAWFHLEQTEETRNSAGHHVLTFRPKSPQFGPLVSLDITIDDAARILAMDLRLLRRFLDDHRDGAFARDIAKSFLQSATPARDMALIGGLISRIETDMIGMAIHHRAAQPSEVFPETFDEMYLTFLGQKPIATQPLSLTKVTLTNIDMGGNAVLDISFETMR
jgi:hypothetical protein